MISSAFLMTNCEHNLNELDYSFENRLVFGYGNGVLNEKRVGDALYFETEHCTRVPGSFREECVQTARVIQEQARDRPIYVLLSGGMDSVAMVMGFIEAGVPFKTATYEFNDGQNAHEMEHVHSLIEREKLDATFYKMDGVKWLTGDEAHELFHQTHSFELGCLPLMKLMEHVWFELGGFPVFGGGDIDIIKRDGTWHYARFESYISRYWYSQQRGIGVFASFFQHTPEITLSMLNEPEIVKAASGQDRIANLVLNELKAVKYKVMHRIWPGHAARPKFGGTEMIHHHIDRTELAWRAESPITYGDTWSVPYNEFRALLAPL